MTRISIASLLGLTLVLPVTAADWPQFRGPDGLGVSNEKGLPVEWGPTKNVRWQVELPGRGLSSPVVAGGKAFVTASSGVDLDRLHVLAFDVASGKKLWHRQLAATGNTMCHPKTTMAAPTPVTDGQFVYALFGTGDLACFSAAGDLVWYRSIVGDYPTIGNNLGLAASPILCEGVLVLPMESVGESFVAGLDTKDGHNLWKLDRAKGLNWVTPLVLRGNGRADLVIQSPNELTAVNPRTGETRWKYSGGGLSSSPSPVAANDLVLAPGGEFSAIQPGKDGEAPKVLWKTNRLAMSYASPLYHDGRVYAANSAGVLNCADVATGKNLWQQRVRGPFSASPIIADGKVYLINERGETSVVQAGNPTKVLAVNTLRGGADKNAKADGGDDPFLATPAVADGAIFLRSDKRLYCVSDK